MGVIPVAPVITLVNWSTLTFYLFGKVFKNSVGFAGEPQSL